MRIVDAYGTRSLDGTSSEFTPFYLMSHPTILSHSFTSDPTNPGTLHIELHIVGVPFFTIYFRDTDGGVQLAIESPQSDLATRTLVSEDATPGAVYDYIYIQNSLSGLAVRAPVVLTIDVDEVSIHPADLEDLNHYSDDTSAFSFYWTTVNSRDPAYQVYRRNTVNIILTPPTTSCGEERNPCSVPYMDGVLKIEGALDSVTYEAEIYVVNDRSSLTSPGINRKYLNKNLAITGQITSGFSVNCHTDNVTIELTVEDGVDFDSIEVWSFNEDDAVNGILVGEELERIPANGSLLAEVSVAGLIGSHLLLFYARLHSLDYEVYGTFQRIQIPVARTQVANEIIFCASTEDSSNAELDAANIIVKYRNEDGDTLCKSSIGSTTRGQRECFLLECDPPICAELDLENTLSISVHNDNSDLWEVKGVMELYLPPSIQYLMNVNGETLRGGNSPILNRRFDDFSDSQTRAAADNEDQLSTSIHSDKWWYIATTS